MQRCISGAAADVGSPSSEIFLRLGPPSLPFSSSTAKVQFIFGAECTVNAIVNRPEKLSETLTLISHKIVVEYCPY